MANISDSELDEIYAFAVQLGKDAGKILMDSAQSRFGEAGVSEDFVEKDSAVDIVTKTDEGERRWNCSNAADSGPRRRRGIHQERSRHQVSRP
jgi:myo-inositol-1(or 4)-monophosphatase